MSNEVKNLTVNHSVAKPSTNSPSVTIWLQVYVNLHPELRETRTQWVHQPRLAGMIVPELLDMERNIVVLKSAFSTAGFLSATLFCVAAAQTAPSNPIDPLYACQTIPADADRLACFDQAVASLKARETAGEIQTVDVAAIESIEKEAFGFSLPSLPSLFRSQSGDTAQRESVSEITVPVKSARIQGVTGKVIVVLENGQTWEQTDTVKVNAFTIKKAKEARIRKAALGSYMLSLDGASGFRAKRIS